MKEKIAALIAGLIVERLTGDMIKRWADMSLDMIEDAIAKSETKLDDKLALPVINAIREGFGIEDNDPV